MTPVTIDPATAQTAASICALVSAGDIDGAIALADNPTAVTCALLMGQTLAGSASTAGLEYDWDAIARAFRTMSLDVDFF